MATRTITGTLYNAAGDPLAGERISFTMDRDTYLLDPDVTYPATSVTARTDATGAFTVELEAGLPVLWNVHLPGQNFVISVPTGSATTLEALRAEYAGGPPAIVRGDTPYAPVFNVKSPLYGARGDGTTDDSAAVQAAIDAASDAGGGVVYFPPGTYLVQLALASGVTLRGAGAAATTLKLPDGATSGAVISSTGFSSLTGGDTTGGVYRCGVELLSVDGNRDNTSGARGIQIYGYGITLRDLHVHDCPSDGIYGEWSDDGVPADLIPLEGYVANVASSANGGHGVHWKGPHDSTFFNVVPYKNDLDGFHIGLGANGCQFVNCHSWGYPQRWAWNIRASTIMVSNSLAEGGGALVAGGQVLFTGANTSWMGGRIFPAGTAGLVGIQIGDTGLPASGLEIMAYIVDCDGGAVVFTNDGGSNRIWPTIYQTTGTVDSGTISTSTDYLPIVAGGVSYTSRAQRLAPMQLRTNSSTALTINDTTNGNIFNVRADSGNRRLELVRGTGLRTYSDGFTTRTFDFDTTNSIMYFGATTTPSIRKGSGSPEGVVSAAVGSLYLRTDGGSGSSHYVKVSGTGNTGWIATDAGEDEFFIKDDFSRLTSLSDLGELGWTGANGSTSAFTSAAGRPGICRRDTSASSGTVAYNRLAATSGGNILPAESFDMLYVFRTNHADTDTAVRIGLGADSTANPPNDGIFLEKVLADTSWFAVTRNTSTQTRSAAMATVDTDWVRLRIRRIDASTIGFTFNALTEVTLTTNVPTVALTPFFQIINGAAASKTLDLDYFSLRITGLSR